MNSLFLALLIVTSSPAHAQSELAAQSRVLDRIQKQDAKAAFQACFGETPPDNLTLEIGLTPGGEPMVRQAEPVASEEVLRCLTAALSRLDLTKVTQDVTVVTLIDFLPSEPETSAPGSEDAEPTTPQDTLDAASKEFRKDLDDTRIIYAPTAIPRGKGIIDITAHDIGLWDVEGGVGDNTSIGLKFLLPVMIYEVMPYFRGGFEVGDDFWLGGTLLGGIAGTMMGDGLAWFAGGSLQMTVVRDPVMFNVSFLAQGMGSTEEDDAVLFMLPNMGVSLRVSRMVKLNFEYHLPLIPEEDSLDFLWGVVGYGVRILGEKIYGDISFFCPIIEGAENLYQYLPLGIPLLSFGFQFNTGAPADITSGADASAATSSWVRDLAFSL